jgi:hypothetical protein
VATSTGLILNAPQQDEVVAISQSRSLPAGYVFRAKLILMLAEGTSFRTIKHKLGTIARTIVRWKERLLSGGINGLDTYHPGQPPSVLTHALRVRLWPLPGKIQPMDRRTGVAATRGPSGRQQRCRAQGVEKSRPEAASDRALPGQRRSRFRIERRRHHRSVPDPP